MASTIASAPSMSPAPDGRGAMALPRGPARARAAIEAWLDAERDQLASWLPVGLGLGVAAWFALPDAAHWTAFLLSALGTAALALAAGRTGRLARAVAWFAFAAALGMTLIWWRAERVRAPVLERTVVATFTARIEAVEILGARDAVRVRLAPEPGGVSASGAAATLPPRVRVSFKTADAPAGLVPGARLALRARLMPPPQAAVPGAYDFARVAWFAGLGATGRGFAGARVIAAGAQGGWWERLGALRARLSAHIAASLRAPEAGVATSLVTGDTGALPQADNDAMRRSGLAHLLSVSGLHVSAVIAAVMLIAMRLLALSPMLALRLRLPLVAAGAGALAGIGYTLLAGAEVPTVRSCIAALLVLGGLAAGREAMTLRLIASGAIVVLLIWPDALAGPSFQLSFAAVTAIVALHEHRQVRAWFARRDEPWPRRLLREVRSLLLTGFVVEAALAPIALFHFHREGLYGAVANIVAIPLTTFVIMPLEAAALCLDAVGLGTPLWWLTERSIALLLAIAHMTADAPGAVRALPAMPRGAFGLMIAGGLWIALWTTPVRRWGALPLAIGALWAARTPPPDLLVTGDGRHLALRTGAGGLALLRERTGEYVRGMLGETAGIADVADALDTVPGARCSADLCLVAIDRGGRRWRLLATRSRYPVDRAALLRACATADIVVSDRRLPPACAPRWLKADAPLLRRTGGLAITLRPGRVVTVAEGVGRHPWAAAP